MPRDPQTLVFVGIKSSVVALDDRTGTEVWRAKLSGSDYVTVMWDGESLIAANNGEVFRLDPASGATLWRNEMKGFRRGLVTLASSRYPTRGGDAARANKQREADAAAEAAT
jgi:outer membrane protein assembly factor BamB